MIFTTYWFFASVLIFLPIFIALKNVPVLRRFFLLTFCVIFHGHFAGPAGVLPIIFIGFAVYFAALSRRPPIILATAALSIGALIFYKYSEFISMQIVYFFSPTIGQTLLDWSKGYRPATPPLAISFFTFEFVHYLYDVYRGSPSIRSLVDFWNFTLFFPSLVAGPIKRYQPFLASLKADDKGPHLADLTNGAVRIGIGFFKKVIIADNLTTYIDLVHPRYELISITDRWIFLALLALRILMDFSGYSDIAIGMAQMLGIKIPENFNWPYLASNIRDFWQRWHISLSSWIRDYVYIPLGGNRHGWIRTAVNGLSAFALCGLWHGPTWNFVFWGLYHGLGLAFSSNYSRLLGPIGPPTKLLLGRLPFVSWAITMIFVGIGWLYFFYPFDEATKMMKLLFVS